MRYLLTSLLCVFTLSLTAQEVVTYPYNPDEDVNGLIASPDLLSLLAGYGEVFSPGEILIDGVSLLEVIQDLQNQINNNTLPDGTLIGDLLIWNGTAWMPGPHPVDDCGVYGGDGSSCALTPITDENIHAAVDMWLLNEDVAEATYGHISEWDVSSVTNMSSMFHSASDFNGDISSWDVSSVTNMSHMFFNADSFNGDLSSWDVSSVTNMNWMFSDASIFNGDLSSWDVSSVTNMNWMFSAASIFNGDLSSWDVSNVTGMTGMFVGDPVSSFNGDISSWDVSSVTDMSYMFGGTSLSEENKCLIHTSFSSYSVWPYDWSEFCPAVCGDLVSHEGYDYSTVLIGDQCWFSENCRYLPEVSPYSVGSGTDPYYYVYGYEGTDVGAAQATSNYTTYGVLYNWSAVMTEGICPSGWHIPSDGEWQTMEISLGMSESDASSTGWRGSPVGNYLKSTSGWNDSGNGSNSSGFNGLPGGYRYSAAFTYVEGYGYWWSASESSTGSWDRDLNYTYDNVGRSSFDQDHGLSARCVRD
jgi:uncharacterized protein (TIGR02145 family)